MAFVGHLVHVAFTGRSVGKGGWLVVGFSPTKSLYGGIVIILSCVVVKKVQRAFRVFNSP